ncbi:2-amino-4-hydroxy-6-hydroxymethyldihydropteridine diphosphokinase [Thalassomonas actiniarum]|uniref:2-amino-4-hydroxy-6-hydroxymethyldihydropteridine pyrophosphokinase n=1 Tax=Thalassomonas actiniarum TaxID=485447 RepID=A0AAE9YP28_9GAMM|nr:2-amino-4-hydroxy-6-hydroxymethyldihydropteridine diphosphokinase [Thalassomonas actiniarum]WDD98232.1 2-amino-4-hydroxy-6-hydroxymethyldihydropteridine diphosphokinase [Thalassomonas actiniarum]
MSTDNSPVNLEKHTAYIGLGSNLSDPQAQIRQAIVAIAGIADSSILRISSLYFSKPMGPQDQPDYMNAVLALTTELTPLALLDALQDIENKAGRVRKDNRWGARVLDLDILLFDQEIIDNERLTVPHYGMKEREFVLLPLAEIAPSLTLPCGESVLELSKNINPNGLKIHSKLG